MDWFPVQQCSEAGLWGSEAVPPSVGYSIAGFVIE